MPVVNFIVMLIEEKLSHSASDQSNAAKKINKAADNIIQSAHLAERSFFQASLEDCQRRPRTTPGEKLLDYFLLSGGAFCKRIRRAIKEEWF